MLEERGFVERSVRATKPPEVTYIPTHRLKDMEKLMRELLVLSDKWQAEDSGKLEEHPSIAPSKARYGETHRLIPPLFG